MILVELALGGLCIFALIVCLAVFAIIVMIFPPAILVPIIYGLYLWPTKKRRAGWFPKKQARGPLVIHHVRPTYDPTKLYAPPIPRTPSALDDPGDI